MQRTTLHTKLFCRMCYNVVVALLQSEDYGQTRQSIGKGGTGPVLGFHVAFFAFRS